MKGRYRHNLWGRIIPPPKTEIIKQVPKRKELNLVEGTIYDVEIVYSDSYNLTRSHGRKKIQKKMKFICETQNLYVFEHTNGLRECFSKFTPENELKIISA
jgi:hypothetical protein